MGGGDNTDENANNIFFTIKDTNLYVPAVTLSARDNQNHQSFVVKDVKYPCIGINIKQKGKIKMQEKGINICSNQPLQELTNCLFRFIQIKVVMLKDLKLEDITYQKVLLRIIMYSLMERTFMTNPSILI